MDSGAVPLACPESRRSEALRWGDDYELLFTLPPATDPCVAATCIGRVVEGPSGTLLLDGNPIESGEKLGFEHH